MELIIIKEKNYPNRPSFDELPDDTEFYAEYDNDIVGEGVFDTETGYCWASPFDAEQYAKDLQESFNKYKRDKSNLLKE